MKEHKKNEHASESAPSPAADGAPLPVNGVVRTVKRPEVWQQPENPGKRFRITTPNRGFNGQRCNDRLIFREGVAYTDSEADAASCRDYGYTVEDAEDEASKKSDAGKKDVTE